MKKKKGWIVVLVLVLVVGLGAGAWLLWGDTLFSDSNEGTVYVQSVSDILGIGYAGLNNQYAGVVEAKDVIKINPDKSLTVAQRYVNAGDSVKEGDPLFAYDVDSMTLAYEQLLIDITGLENSIQTDTEELASLEKQISKAKESKVYELKLQKQTVELNIRKNTYELESKKQKAEDTKAAIENSVVTSPVTGTIRSVNDEDNTTSYYYYGMEQSSDYITIVAGTDFCIKCTVSEQTIHSLREGTPALIRSRTDKNVTYVGNIYKINTEPESNNNSYYYYDDGSGESASKYAFYVELDTIEGLLVGQHVYVEPGNDGSGNKTGLQLPEYYIMQENGKAYVYAQDGNERIEKREVTLGAYDEATMCYEITAGLALSDKIAYPDDSVQVGMKCSTTQYNDEDMGDVDIDYQEYDDGMNYGDLGDMGDLGEMGDFNDLTDVAPEESGSIPQETVTVPSPGEAGTEADTEADTEAGSEAGAEE